MRHYEFDQDHLKHTPGYEFHGEMYDRLTAPGGKELMTEFFLGIQVWRVRLLAFVVAGIFGSIGGLLMSLFVSSAYPDFAYWTISGEGVFMILMGGIGVFLGPLAGAVVLLLLADIVTGLTEYFGLVLGIVILFFALGMRKGLLGFLLDLWKNRRAPAGSG